MALFLNSEQAERIKNALRKSETHPVDSIHYDPLPSGQPVWIYIAKTTSIVSAMDGYTIGGGYAKIYYMDRYNNVYEKNIDPIVVYNLTCHTIPIDSYVILRRDPYSGKYIIDYDRTLNAGCGITITTNPEQTNCATVSVDVDDLAGEGLKAGESGCELDIDVGCGMTIYDHRLAIDNESIAGDGLTTDDVWDDEHGWMSCELHVNPGCGLLIDEENQVSVDMEVSSILNLDVLTDVELSVVGSQICIKKEFRRLTLSENSCGVIIGAEVSIPCDGSLQLGQEVEECIETPCCSSGSLSAMSEIYDKNPELVPFWDMK